MSSKLSRFWNELKRRRVIHVITVYASATFVIIELINNLAEPLNLPDKLLTIVIIVLAVGFPLAVILSWLFDLTPGGMERTLPLEEEDEVKVPFVPSKWKIATIVSFVVIAALVTMNIVGLNRQAYGASLRSLVVLPAGNYTGDDQLEYFVDGMHSSLVSAMGQVGKLRVVGETSANAYKDADKPLPVIASELKVTAALEPTVMCLGDTICMQVKLVTLDPEEKQVWVGNYKEAKDKVMDLKNQIVKDIARDVGIKLTRSEKEQLSTEREHKPAVLEAIYKGRFHMHQHTPEGLKLGIKYYEEAIAMDPADPLPYLGLAQGYSLAGHVSGVIPDAAERAEENARKALALDSTLAEAYVVLASRPLYTDWDFVKAEKYLVRALELNQNIAMAHYHYGWYLMLTGDMQKALAEFEISWEIEPIDVTYPNNIAALHVWIGQYEEALDMVEKALELNPSYPYALYVKGSAYSGLGRHEEAIKTHQKGLAISGGFENGLGTAFAMAGREEEAREIAAQLEEYDYTWYTWALADIYAVLGDTDKAIHWIGEAFDRRQDFVPWFSSFINFQDLQDDPRFQEIVNRIAYPE